MAKKLRQFPFFEVQEVRDTVTNEPLMLLKDLRISCITYNTAALLIGDSSGSVYCLNKDLSFSVKFGAYNVSLDHMCISQTMAMLVCVGTDAVNSIYTLKAFDLNILDTSGVPSCYRNSPINCSDQNAVVSALAAQEDLNQVAFGFTTGTIVLYNDVIKRRRFGSFPQAPRQKEIKYHKTPITNLVYQKHEQGFWLIVSTLESLSFITIDKVYSIMSLEKNIGCDPRCMVAFHPSWKGKDDLVAVASQKTINCYNPGGKVVTLPLSGKKVLMRAFGNNLMIVTRSHRKSYSHSHMSDVAVDTSSLTIITMDKKSKYISFSKDFPDIFEVVFVWNAAHMITSKGKMYRLNEVDVDTKIRTFIRGNFYDLAISLAKRHGDLIMLNRILRRYGDKLYSDGDLDGAMKQYIETIGNVEPSYIIRKYLEAQNIQYLTQYLEKLHTQCANSDHTTLLLNCYIRLKETEKIDSFLRNSSNWHFDVLTALRVCYQAGLHAQALYLAEKANFHDWYLRIQLEDLRDYRAAIKYLKNLTLSESGKVLKQYGSRLMKESPSEVLEYVILLCKSSSVNTDPYAPEDFIHIFVHSRSALRNFLEQMLSIDASRSEKVYNTLIEMYVHEWTIATDANTKEDLQLKCIRILEFDYDKFDSDHVLMICQMNNFFRGLEIIYEKRKHYSMIVEYLIDSADYRGIISSCQKYEKLDPSVWMLALRYFISNYDTCEVYTKELIDAMNEKDVIPSLALIKMLIYSDKIKMNVIKDFICNKLMKIDSITKSNEQDAIASEREIAFMDKTINDIRLGGKIIQNSKCDTCGDPLSLPVVHFLCDHSFHQSCVETVEWELRCPLCFEKIMETKEVLKQANSVDHINDLFLKEINSSPEIFDVVQKYLKWNVFNRINVDPPDFE